MLAVAVSARASTAYPLDRGDGVPQASDPTVANDARWGSRPMAEHRVMSEALLCITHYRSKRCDESHVEVDVPTQPLMHRRHTIIASDVNVFVLDRSPQP